MKNLKTSLTQSPCPMSWNSMEGSERRRFCEHCSKHVHNLSALTSWEVRFLTWFKRGNLCVRFIKTQDGFVRTLSLPSRIRSVLTGALAVLLGMLPIACATPPTRSGKEKVTCAPINLPKVSEEDLQLTIVGDESIVLESSNHRVKDLQTRKGKR